MDQSDPRPAGDQKVTALIPARPSNILSLRLIMKYFLLSLSLPLIQGGQFAISSERMSTSTGQLVRGLSLPRKKCG